MKLRGDPEEGLPLHSGGRPAGRRGQALLGSSRKAGRRKEDPVQQLFNWTIAVLLLLVAFYVLRRVRPQGFAGLGP